MKLELIEKNYVIGEKLKGLIEKKVGKLEKYFGDNANCKVVCKSDNKQKKLEITITGKGSFFRSEVSGDNMYQNLDLALPKIEKQIIKFNGKRNELFKMPSLPELLYIDDVPEDEYNPKITRRKSFELDPMGEDEAIYMLEALDHDFYVFLNGETGKVNVVYRKGNDEYGIIEIRK